MGADRTAGAEAAWPDLPPEARAAWHRRADGHLAALGPLVKPWIPSLAYVGADRGTLTLWKDGRTIDLGEVGLIEERTTC